jgi:hypothetical protein
MKKAEQHRTAAAIANPALTATVLSLLADMMRHRSGARLDNVATLQRLVADLSEELAARIKEEADEPLTVVEAAAIAGVTPACIRQWVVKHRIGSLDPHSHIFLISKSRLHDYLLRRHGGHLPDAMKSFFAA